jgi:hypothetical protein
LPELLPLLLEEQEAARAQWSLFNVQSLTVLSQKL